MPLMKFSTVNEVTSRANALITGFAGSIWTSNPEAAVGSRAVGNRHRVDQRDRCTLPPTHPCRAQAIGFWCGIKQEGLLEFTLSEVITTARSGLKAYRLNITLSPLTYQPMA
jgi:aldehyde dehydrogenase (NAD+)